MLPTAQELALLTQKAIAEGKELAKQKAEQERLKRDQENIKHLQIATAILDKVAGVCREAAGDGLSGAMVMKLLLNRDYELPQKAGPSLKGPGLMVWNHLVGAGLAPTLENCWDDNDSWYEIVVHW